MTSGQTGLRRGSSLPAGSRGHFDDRWNDVSSRDIVRSFLRSLTSSGGNMSVRITAELKRTQRPLSVDGGLGQMITNGSMAVSSSSASLPVSRCKVKVAIQIHCAMNSTQIIDYNR